MNRHDQSGFSLIEAMVALAVLAIATVGLVGMTESHIDSTRGMERRAAAMWVAENHLAELEAGIAAPEREVEMLGERWRIAVDARGTDDASITAVTIAVSAVSETAPGASALASLDAFLDAGI